MSSRRVILISGANTGLGLEIVKALYKSSVPYDILLGSRSQEKGEEAIKSVKKEITKSESTLTTVQIDVSSDDSISKAVKEAQSRFGVLDVLINNAGANYAKAQQQSNSKMSLREAWNASWDTNVTGAQILTHEVIPLLLKSSDPRLLFITSGTSSMMETELTDTPISARLNAPPSAGWPKPEAPNPIEMYRSSKAGLNMMMRTWYQTLGNDGVKVWAISPGFLATGLNNIGAEKLKQIGALDPSEGAEFVKDVIEGKRDKDVGKVIRFDSIQAW